jgi:aminocarboxymuconate-semialdehyde decarboxylase
VRIDVHNHAYTRPVEQLLRDDPVYGVTFENGTILTRGDVPFDFEPEFFDADAKLEELARNGLDAAVISVAPTLFYYELEADPAERISRTANEGLAGFCAAHPDRLRWLATVPLGAPERVVAVLEEAAAGGAAGVEIGTSTGDRRLDDSALADFWAAAERLALPVLIHPAYHHPHPGLGDWYFENAIGNPLETTVAIERLICARVLDNHPGLTIVLAHAGGYYPYAQGRLRHAATVRPELASAPSDPLAYPRILVDTITHDPVGLRFIVDRLGPDRVVLGTDLPFDMATPEPVAALEAAFDAATADKIADSNPRRVFGFRAA